MLVITVLSTKGGVGKSTVTANLAGLLADAGSKILMIDLDNKQPTLSSYYPLKTEASGGIFELLTQGPERIDQVISKTTLPNLDIIVSNDHNNQLHQFLLSATDGRFRLIELIQCIAAMHRYDVVLMDTQGARSILLEAAVLACDRALSPITPELLSAREFVRGTVTMFDELMPLTQYTTVTLPPISVVINRLDETRDARIIVKNLRAIYETHDFVRVLDNPLRQLAAFRMAASEGVPIHRFEPVRPSGRKAPSGLEQIRTMAEEFHPDWKPLLENIGVKRYVH